MSAIGSLNPFARRLWTSLLAVYPEWSAYFGVCGDDDLEVAVPSPQGSTAGHLVRRPGDFVSGVPLPRIRKVNTGLS
jgi:hypothetical protein